MHELFKPEHRYYQCDNCDQLAHVDTDTAAPDFLPTCGAPVRPGCAGTMRKIERAQFIEQHG